MRITNNINDVNCINIKPKKIKYCLNAHNVGYSKYNSCEILQVKLQDEDNIAIVSQWHSYFKIHTFATLYNETYYNINNYCNSKTVSKENTLLEDALEINSDKNTFGIKNRFIIGHILKEKNR